MCQVRLAGGGKVEGSKSNQAIVVNTVLKNVGSVVLLDKATSGINGTRAQHEKKQQIRQTL